MKKIVFILLLLTCIKTYQVSASSLEFELDNFDIYIQEERTDGERTYQIEKRGLSPFRVDFHKENSIYYFKGVKNYNDLLYLFGSTHSDGAPTYYDGFILVYNEQGELLEEYITDFNSLEEVENIYQMNQLLIVHTVKHKDVNGELVFDENVFSMYDSNFTLLDTLILNKEIMYSKETPNYVLFSTSYDLHYDFGINADLEVVYNDNILEGLDGSVFQEEVYLNFINNGILNNEKVSNGHMINYPGYYSFIYNQDQYDFEVTANIDGVVHNEIYQDEVTIHFSGGNATLNNELIVDGHIVSSPGEYRLLVTGVNGYNEIIDFTISSNTDGLINGKTYHEATSVTFNGNGYLNDIPVESPFIVDEEGDYVFKVLGENDYLETYTFSLHNDNPEITMLSFIQRFDIVILIVTILAGAIILRKK